MTHMSLWSRLAVSFVSDSHNPQPNPASEGDAPQAELRLHARLTRTRYAALDAT